MKKLALMLLATLPLWAQRHATITDLPYPAAAAQTGIKGVVVLQVNVSAQGKVEDAQTLSGNPLLAKPAADNVKTWEFAGGKAEQLKVMYMFVLQGHADKMTYDAGEKTAVITGARPPSDHAQ